MAVNRRSWFKKLAEAAAIVALAPQLCFKPRMERIGFWYETTRLTRCTDPAYEKAIIDIFTDNFTKAQIQKFMVSYYNERSPR